MSAQKFMVKFNKGVTQAQKDKYIENLSSQLDGSSFKTGSTSDKIKLFSGNVFDGFAVTIPNGQVDQLTKGFTSDEIIDYIEPDGVVTIQ